MVRTCNLLLLFEKSSSFLVTHMFMENYLHATVQEYHTTMYFNDFFELTPFSAENRDFVR